MNAASGKQSRGAIYTPLGLSEYEVCHPVRQEDFDAVATILNGLHRAKEWVPIVMQLVREDGDKALCESDSPWLGAHALIFRSHAADAMRTMLMDHGELLPLTCQGANLLIYNATRVIDALDERESDVQRFRDGRIIMIQRYVFRGDPIAGVDVFKIPSLKVSPTFVSQRFVDRWGAVGLKGLGFKKVWAPTN